MSASDRLHFKSLHRLLALFLLACALAIASYTGRMLSDPGDASAPYDSTTATGSSTRLIASHDPASWKAFAPGSSQVDSSDATHASRILRYVGPFFSKDDQDGSELRFAIIELIDGGKQDYAGVGDTFESYKVTRIEQSHVSVEKDGILYDLYLSFTNTLARRDESPAPLDPDPDAEQVLEVNRFGKRVGEHRWVVQRNALMEYYEELSDDPERLVAVFDSLEPDYDEERKIKGYKLVTKGEADFFKAIGLTENDYVRKVNSMNMISRQRAEYFIGEFMKERLGGVVLDIERNGKPEKLIYFVR